MIGLIPNPDQVNLHRLNPVCLMSYARWYKAQSLYTKQRFAKGVQRNITDFLKASITTDSIKIFSITFCTLVTVYCTCKIAKDAFRIVLYVTTFYMQHCAVARFVLKQWFVYDCTYVADMYNVECYWRTVSLYCELINLRYHPPSGTLLALIGASAFAFN